jgi:hypothetical protein
MGIRYERKAGGGNTHDGDTTIANGSGLIVGHGSQLTVQGLVPELQVLGTGNEDGSILMAAFGGVIPRLHLARGESTSVGTFTNALDADDDIGEIVFVGSDGTDFAHPAAKIIGAADGQMSSNDVPGRLEFWTAAGSGTTLTERLRIDSAGSVFIGDTANTKMTQGLTINQGAADDQAISLKSSDVGHGLTSAGYAVQETDTYLSMRKQDAGNGGAEISAFMQNVAAAQVLVFDAHGGTATTTKATNGVGLVNFRVMEHDGSNALANVTADGNVFSIQAQVGGTMATRWILDEDGDTWQPGGATFGGTTTVGGVDVGKGMAKVWCHITAAGALAAGSFNVASVTDSSTGRRVVVFDTDFSSANSSCHGTVRSVLDDNDATHCAVPVAGSVALNHWRSNTFTDAENQFVAFGDQ